MVGVVGSPCCGWWFHWYCWFPLWGVDVVGVLDVVGVGVVVR